MKRDLIRIAGSTAFAVALLLAVGSVFGQPAPQPGPAPASPTGQPATISVVGCFGSILSIDGYTVKQVGNTRTLQTAPIAETSHVRVTATGPVNSITGDVTVEPGKVTSVTLNWSNDTLTFAVASRMPVGTVYYAPAFGGCAGGRCR